MKYIKTYEAILNDYYAVARQVHNLIPNWKIGEDYVINKDFSVSFLTNRGVPFYNEFNPERKITKLPFKIRDVLDTPHTVISLDYNKLVTLEGCPDKAPGNFWCDHNELTSLKGCPTFIGGSMTCHQNKLTSLEYLPKVMGTNDYSHNMSPNFLDYGDNPCWDDENQLKYLPLNLMILGTVHNIFISSTDIGHSMSGGWIFVMKKDIMDSYWEEKINENVDLILEHKLSVCDDNWELNKTQYKKGYTYVSNEISKSLYKKLKFLGRGKDANLWDFKN